MAKVKVVRVWRRHPQSVIGDHGGRFPVVRAWRIRGIEEDRFVLACASGLTITDYFGNMVDCWHAGISAGDLARLAATRTGARAITPMA